MSDEPKPSYTPVHRLPQWLSSEDVFAAIRTVGLARSNNTVRATCWDIETEIRKLVEAPSTTEKKP